ncbi:MAG TPA: hypothetical protein VHF28_04685 [Nitrososphaera sp.]|jgi:hypothetical protein|nr:hypothetical protein [Nitrososphaera sp.]
MARSILSPLFLAVLLLGAILSVMSMDVTIVYAQDAGMVKTTDNGSLDIRLVPQWNEAGQATFTVNFLNPGSETLHDHQDYDFRILRDGQQVFSAASQTGQAVLHNVEGTLTIPYTFPENGDYTIQVYLAGVGLPAIPTDEEALFPITVVPEFPAGGILAALLVASMTTAVVLSQRFRLI